jgi:hypothetical protein
MPHIEALIIWLTNRGFVLAQAVLSGYCKAPPMLARLLMGFLDTVLSALHECYE